MYLNILYKKGRDELSTGSSLPFYVQLKYEKQYMYK